MDALDAPGGCPRTVWDGPYKMRCSLGVDICAYHGRFRKLEPPVIFNELLTEQIKIRFTASADRMLGHLRILKAAFEGVSKSSVRSNYGLVND